MSIAYFEKCISEASNTEINTNPVVAVVNEGDGNVDGYVVSILHFGVAPESKSAVLWYFATDPAYRNSGIGRRVYQDLLEILNEIGAQTLVFEVEIPKPEVENSSFATRRILWYQKQGAMLLGGYSYLQSIDSDMEPVPMFLMAQSLNAESNLTPQFAMDVCKTIFGDAVKALSTPYFTESLTGEHLAE